jgi:hypothetical protein
MAPIEPLPLFLGVASTAGAMDGRREWEEVWLDVELVERGMREVVVDVDALELVERFREASRAEEERREIEGREDWEAEERRERAEEEEA